MATLPNLQNMLDSVSGAVSNFSTKTLPMIQSTIQSARQTVQAITKGKNPTPTPIQQPAAVQELVPRNMGGLSAKAAFGVSGTMLIVGVLAIAAVWYVARRRR